MFNFKKNPSYIRYPFFILVVLLLLGLGYVKTIDTSPTMQVTATLNENESGSFVQQDSAGDLSQVEVSFFPQAVTVVYPNSPLRQPLPSNVTYTRDTRVGSMRQGEEQWQLPVYRSDNCNYPLVSVDNRYSDRVENWPIPINARPATAADAHLGLICPDRNEFYEMWEAEWLNNSSILAGGMVDYDLNGNGITPRSNRRTTASGIAMSNGIVSREDFTNSEGVFDPTITSINHALNVSLPARLLSRTFISPAVGFEEAGSAGTNGIPMGAVFALPRNLDIDSIPNLHPFTRIILRAARDYGMYVTDGNGSAANPDGSGNANVRVEMGLLRDLYGVSNDSLMSRIQSETRSVISSVGVWRVNFSGGSITPVPATTTRTPIAITPSPTRTPTLTRTPIITPSRTPTNQTSTPTPIILQCPYYVDRRQIICTIP